jgi:glycosyltransferase involved in cell wall biosynthesis
MQISIIIPSAGRRPELLKRAINSAHVAGLSYEILVILNGKDGFDFKIDDSYINQNVQYYKIVEGNVSKARNYGLTLAKGQLVRFLDDDDYLYTDIALKQYEEMLANITCAVSNYAIDLKAENTDIYQTYKPSSYDDYVSNAIYDGSLSVPFSLVYRRNYISDLEWDELCRFPEDQDFIRQLAMKQDVKWIKSNVSVGVWFQHESDRLSVNMITHWFVSNKYRSLINLKESLEKSNRLTDLNRQLLAETIWHYIHLAFFFNPLFWYKASIEACKLVPNSKPDRKIFYYVPSIIDPILIEILIIPKKWFFYGFKYFRQIILGNKKRKL